MHRFDYRFLADSLPAELTGIAGIVYDLRARNDLRMRSDVGLAQKLRQAAIIESVRGSNAIEGIITTQARLRQIVQEGAAPLTHGEYEIAGYKDALQEIYASDFVADISEDYIKHLHYLLLHSTSEQAGYYKTENNWIQERDPDGRISVRFVPVAAKETPAAMEQLVMAYREARQDSRINSVALVASTVVDFLCIHPFTDGNGRVSRLLTTMLLQRAGFDIGRLVSLEGMVDEYKAGYYDALRVASQGWHDNESNYMPFILYLYQILYASYKELDRRYVDGGLAQIPKAKRVEAALLNAYVPVSKAEICQRFPEVSATTVERVIGRLVKDGVVEKIGTYRNARYRRL